MENINPTFLSLLQSIGNEKLEHIEKIPQSGGDRSYYRLHTDTPQTYIATVSDNVKENEAFIAFSKHFAAIGAQVPNVLAVGENRENYLQQDVGNQSLLDVLEQKGYTEEVFELYKKSLDALAFLQIQGDKDLNYNLCITSKSFGQQAIKNDLLYFKYYFLDTLKIPYDKEQLLADFENLSTQLSDTSNHYFMFRDFQSRNIMINNGDVCFIDYQGGMKGALQYDAASLLWQAKSNLSEDWKIRLFDYYMERVEKNLGYNIDKTQFEKEYQCYVLIRLLQVLGAYGFRGLFERKAHFLSSIPLALKNLSQFLQNHSKTIVPAFFQELLLKITDKKIIARFETTKATPQTPLVVKINSFSYLQNGYPKDETKNGGGFVFDCRGILNPGRIEEYKKQSGQDKPVKDYLEQHTLMPDFLHNVCATVDIAVENYIQRGFESLDINFGCTGGQHRSVYAAEALNRHLKNKFGVKTILQHLNKNNWLA